MNQSSVQHHATNHAVSRVLCVDDHALLIEGLRAKFAIDGSFEVVGQLSSAQGLLESVEELTPDVVLLDIEMPGPDIFETADRLRRLHPNLRFVFLTAHIRDGYLAAAYECGAWGYFAKSDQLDDIVSGLRELMRSSGGTFVMGPKIKEHCTATRRQSQDGPSTLTAALTAHEVEVLHLIGKGLSRVAIAHELSRSVKTIDGHQERLMKKLKISSRADLVRYAIREGFAEA